jgi:hypothetical protein
VINKTKHMKINSHITNLEQYLMTDGQVFARVQSCRYLGTLINSKNVISEEIKPRIAAGNRCFYSL